MFSFYPLPEFWKTLFTSTIGVLTLIGIMTRPFRWNEALIAMAGAGLLLLLGLVTPADAFFTLIRDWNTFLFFLGMMSVSALVEEAGLFDWLAVQAARLAGKSAARLFLNVFLLGSLISMVLSNDATALILTPIVYVLVTKLRLPVLPYLFACTFIADTASFLLPVSNPINIIILSRFPLDLPAFLRLLFLPSLVVIAINIGIFFLLYRKQLKGSFDIRRLPSAKAAVKHKAYFWYTCCVLVAVAVAYVIASATQLPLSLVALSGAGVLLIGGLSWRRTCLRQTAKRISWSIFGFIAGMFIVVRAIEDTGLTTMFGNWLIHLSGSTSFGAVMVGTAGAALGTNLINNVPMAVVMISALGGIQHAPPAVQHGFIAAHEMQQAEHAAAEDILNEGLHYLPNAEALQRQGRPEREIVNAAAEWQADLVIICPRAEYGDTPHIGPKSVGHVARFVIDHAPCPVLLVRPLAREQFPIPR